MAFVVREAFLRRVILHAVNHRVQDFQDPLTSTLVLMATSPLQCVMCESGLLLFKTHLLPVIPYGLFHREELAQLHALIAPLGPESLHETVESNGQYTLTVIEFNHNPGRAPSVHLLGKGILLSVFVALMMASPNQGGLPDANRTLCNIVLQRFLSRVSTPSEIVSSVMSAIVPAACIKEHQAASASSHGSKKRKERA